MKEMLLRYAMVGAAGSVGAMLRLAVNQVAQLLPTTFPIGTLAINVSGSFLLGWFLTAYGQRVGMSENVRIMVAVGFVGAYTTFSTYMFDSDKLLRQGDMWRAAANLIGSLVLGMIAVRLGVMLGTTGRKV